MKFSITIPILLLFAVHGMRGQESSTKLYDPAADAQAQIADAVAEAGASKKHVLIQIGGNWCGWCLRLNKLMTSNPVIDSILACDFVVIHVNYSRENQNLPTMARLGFPQRFGFPVLVVLDAKRNRLHTQDSGLLEQGKGHDPDKVLTFLKNWAPSALDPAVYAGK